MAVHFILRIPLMTRVDGRSFNTIEAHNEVVERTGRVALAKFGKDLGSSSRYDMLKNQIQDGVETRLILVVKRADKFLGYQAPLASVHQGDPGQLVALAPAYYSRIGERPRLWFVAKSPFTRSELGDLRLVSNQRPVVRVMSECRTSAMLVERATG